MITDRIRLNSFLLPLLLNQSSTTHIRGGGAFWNVEGGDQVDGASEWVVRGQKAVDVISNVKYIRKSLCTSPNRVFQHQNVGSSAPLTSV